MPHFICTGGCKGVSDTPGVCQTEGCAKHGEPLVECECTDGNHGGMDSPKEPASKDTPSEG